MRYLLLFLAVVLQINNAAGYTVSVPQKICMQKELTLNFCAENVFNIRVYAYCKNNPVNRIDPDGRDDIFSNSGIFLRKDNKKTEFIMIETKAKDGTVNTLKINEQKLSNRAIESIVGHYNSQLDKSDGKMNGTKIETVYMDNSNILMRVKNDNFTTIQVNKRSSDADSGGGRVRKEINTVSNMKSTLVHERDHVNQFSKKRSDVKKMELDAIETQREHSTWKSTTDEYKDMIKRLENSYK